MSVVSKIVSGPGGPHEDAFDIYPVRCPDDLVWAILNRLGEP